MVDMAHIAGLIATGAHPSCIGQAQVVTSTTHKTMRGPRGAFILCDEEFASNIDKGVFPRTQGGPFMHIIAAKAVAFGEAMTPQFREYQEAVLGNAKALSEELQKRGFRIVSGGTDNHLLLVDVSPLGITGQQAEQAFNESLKKHIYHDTHYPTRSGVVDESITSELAPPEDIRAL